MLLEDYLLCFASILQVTQLERPKSLQAITMGEWQQCWQTENIGLGTETLHLVPSLKKKKRHLSGNKLHLESKL